MSIEPGTVLQGLLLLFGMGTTYGLIRADLIRLHEKISDVKATVSDVRATASRAHERIDDHITTSHVGK